MGDQVKMKFNKEEISKVCIDMNALKHLEIQTEFPWPINIIFDQNTMQKYNKIFQFRL